MKGWIRKLPPMIQAATMIVITACALGESTGPAGPQVNKGLLANGEVIEATVAPAIAPADTQYRLLTIDDDVSQWHQFGPHALYMPSRAVCDPYTSGYGPTYWLLPCTRRTVNTQVSVKWWTDSRGYVRAEFRPDLRFHPQTNPWLYLKDWYGATRGSSAILYCIDGTDICTNESLLDPNLATRRDAANGWVYRIIRHFSGYNVWA